MSRGLGRIERAIWTLFEGDEEGYAVRPDARQMALDIYGLRGLDAPPTRAQYVAVLRAMHSLVRKFGSQFALTGGKGRSPLILYEVGDPRRYLATKLAEPLPTTDGGVLRTIGNVVVYVKALAKRREMGQAWQQVAKLILSRASAESIQPQLSLALLMDGKLALGHKRARAKAPARAAATN